ncbi:MAG TPA: SDR family oxidoreductase [Dongiaceae bacterium]|nr:SDR family oxidoreductase [Dongiaceae bacterium]
MKAILTGHSRGLGAAIAAELLGRGIPTLGLARRAHAALGRAHGSLLTQVEIDLADDAALADWLGGGALRHFLDSTATILLINNAGTVQPVGPTDTQAPSAIAQAVSLNVAAPLMLAGAAAALHGATLHHAGAGTSELRILHISSGAARNAYAGWAIYCATKAALDHHARAVALDNSAGVKICSLAPGIIDTDMQAEIRASTPEQFPDHDRFVALKRDGNLAKPEDAAHKLVTYLLSDAYGQEAIADLRQITV